MNTTKHDRRRYGVIETQFRQIGKIAMWELRINGKLWSCVEWSPSRRGWCIQDGSGGRCLSHCDAIHGQDVDAETAVRLAKQMIVDGRMPTPEEAAEQLAERLERDRLGEPMAPITDQERDGKLKLELDHSGWPEHIRRHIR